jgi:copper(I)-binding protein
MTALRTLLVCTLLAIGAAALAAPPASPEGVRVEHAWIRWLPANLPAAGYAEIVNDSNATVSVTSARSADYGMVMLHRSRLADSDSRMEKVDRLDIPAHASVTLAPGGYHLMLMHAQQVIKPGDKVPVILHFASGKTLQVDFPVLPANASGPSD